MKRQDRPNIVLLLSDQQRPDSLGCYGNSVARTPVLDGLAERGAAFDACYVQNPLCCPSRYSLLTGRYPHSHRVRANWYAPRKGEESFAHRVSRSGYNTAAIGKMHLTPWHDLFGFDGRIIAESKFHTTCPDDYERFLNKHGRSRTDLYDIGSPEYVRQCTAVKSIVPQELHIDSFVGRSTCEYLERVQEPFVCFSSFLSPHNPYDPPEPYIDMYDPDEIPPRNMSENEVNRKPREAYDYINTRLGWPFTTDKISEEQRRLTWTHYLATCSLIDDWVGRIVDTLKKRGLYENTILIYSSDHGDLLGDHGLVYKQCFYEASVRVPLIVHAPGIVRAGRIDEPVELMDLFSTICDYAQVDAGPGVQARSLRPILEDFADRRLRETAFSENYFGRMVRFREWKMVYYPGRPYGEIYNLHEDIDEQRNLWDKLEGSTTKADLKDLLLDWAFASEDPLPLPVRPDHMDQSTRQYELHHGGTRESPTQHWYLPWMQDLYETWEFSTDGNVRG